MKAEDCGLIRLNCNGSMFNLNDHIDNPFILGISQADIAYAGKLSVEVGKSYLIELDDDLNEVLDCYATVEGELFFDCEIIKYNKTMYNDIEKEENKKNRTFIKLMTSESVNKNSNENDYAKLGYKSIVNICIYAKLHSEDKSLYLWDEFIKYGLNNMKERKYDLSILFIEIGFESYIDYTLYRLFKINNLNQSSIETILKNINSMDAKVYSLLNSLGKINPKEIPDISYWKRYILKTRNLIAHGSKKECNYKDAKRTYNFVINAIKYIEMNIIK